MTAAVDAAVAVFFVAVLAVVSVVDVKQRIVPNRIVLPAAAVVLAARTIVHPSVVWVVAGAGAAAFLLATALARPGGMGMGDVKLALLLGVAVGRTVPLALIVALVAAVVPSVVLLVRHGRAGRTMGIPFAPFLALGGVVALIAGAPLG
jgi:leader peptidase (prepilin peptidase) / N-methyltransferase